MHMKTSKSPNDIALIAYVTALRSFPLYHHKFSPKKFTQPQLFALLVLKEFFKADYRGVVEIIRGSSDLQRILQLKKVPHYTTVQKVAQRLLRKGGGNKLLTQTLIVAKKLKALPKTIQHAAIDGTGFESHHVSIYFVKRSSLWGMREHFLTYARFPKVGIVTACREHLVLSGVPSQGPSPDILHFKQAVKEAHERVPIRVLLADAGYDSEESHRFVREELGIHTIIPARVGRPTHKLPQGRYRRRMSLRFNKKAYGHRWQGETLNSMIKRLQGSFLRARSYWSRCRELMLKLIAHNVMIVLPG